MTDRDQFMNNVMPFNQNKQQDNEHVQTSSYNNSSLAIKESIKDIFDEFTQVISAEFEYQNVSDLNSKWKNFE